MKAWRQTRGFFLIVSAASLALIILGTLQYRWVVQMSQTERERLNSSLRIGADRIREDVNRELARAYLSFQIDAATITEHQWERYARRYQHWFTTAPYPELVGEVYLVEVNQLGRIHFSRYDAASGRFRPSLWPKALAPILAGFEQAYPQTEHGASQTTGAALAPVAAQIPALVIPAAREWRLTDRETVNINADLLFADGSSRRLDRPCVPCAAADGDQIIAAHTIVTLNQDYITQKMLPELARQYLAAGTTLEYNVRVVDRADPRRVIYRSNDEQTDQALPSDATVNLFSIQFDALNRLLLTESTRFDEGDPSDAQHIAIGILGSGATDGTSKRTTADDDHWQLQFTHRAGSLEAVINQLFWRNFAMSFGGLLLLATTVALLLVSTRRAQRLAVQKLEFVASISHELRTPLAVLSSAGENLADGIINDLAQAQRYGEVIRSESRRLTGMVEQALEFAGMQSGRKLYELRPVNVDQVLRRALAEYQSQISSSGFVVEQSIALDLPLVLADAKALCRSIQNLLSNAMKYSGDQHWIGVSAQPIVGPQGSAIQITVRDRGIGIAASEVAHVFDPFFRGRAAVDAQIHGSGLGLSLVQHMIEAHDGSISVTSAPGQGSTFTMRLPALAPSVGAAEARKGAYEQAHLARRG